MLSITNTTTLMKSVIVVEVFFSDSHIKYRDKMCRQNPELFNAYKIGSYSSHLSFTVIVQNLFIHRSEDEAGFSSGRFARHAKRL